MAKGTRPHTTRMESGKRSDTAHRTLEQARDMSSGYEAQPKRRAYRSELNKMRKEYGLKKGDLKEVGHITPASKGGGGGKENTRVVSRELNRTTGDKPMGDTAEPKKTSRGKVSSRVRPRG